MQSDKVSEVVRLLRQARDLVRDAQIKVSRLQINGGTSERYERIIEALKAEMIRLGN